MNDVNEQEMKNLLEACLLSAGRPVTTQQLLELFEERERPSQEQMLSWLASLAADYAARGIELVEVASGWRIQIRSQCVEFVSRLWQERPARYSRALLETLALIAYRQPITRGEIEDIRGVTVSSNIMRTLHERNWIRVLGHREVPGRPEILGTTKEFLDYFGLKGLDELPSLAELKDVETMGVQLEFNTAEAPATTEANAAEAAGEPVEAAEVASDAAETPAEAAETPASNDASAETAEAPAEDVETPAAQEVEAADSPDAQSESADTEESQDEPAEETQP